MTHDVDMLAGGDDFYSVPRTDEEIAARMAQLHCAIRGESQRQDRLEAAIANLMRQNPNWSKAHATRMFESMMLGTSYAAAHASYD
jgi:hypothetical protein